MKNGRLPPAISLIIAHDIYADVGAEEPEVNDKVWPAGLGPSLGTVKFIAS